MNIKFKLIFITVLFLFNSVFANVFDHKTSLKQIAPKIPKPKNISCKFKQDKFIASSNVHLKSSGNFKFDKEKGITFYTLFPVKSTINYENKNYRQINKIIKAMSEKNYSKLENDFNFYFEQQGNNWFFGLKPKENSKIENYVSAIEIQGNYLSEIDISKIIINTVDKTKTTIDFLK